jgi:hypothetical protein
LISKLRSEDVALWQSWQYYCAETEGFSTFIRNSGFFPLTGKGKFNTAGLFAEISLKIASRLSRVGIIVPTGIVTDDSAKDFFNILVRKQFLLFLYDFENREGLFPSVDSRYRFCLLTFGNQQSHKALFSAAFWLTSVSQIKDSEKVSNLSSSDIFLINPNSGTCPVVRSKRDLEILRTCHKKHGVLIQNDPQKNLWGAIPTFMFQMSDSEGKFKNLEELDIYTERNRVYAKAIDSIEELVPLYEAKLVHQFDHRYATFVGQSRQDIKSGNAREISLEEKVALSYSLPRYWISNSTFLEKMKIRPARGKWLLSYREIARASDERTFIACILPYPSSII